MNILEIQNLNKSYSSFSLRNVSFKLDQGYIMGFIGENGAGKTTVLRCMLNLVKKESGSIKIFGKNMDEHEIDIKQDIAFMSGDVAFYPGKKLSVITDTFKRFYKNWDEEAYNKYMKLFNLDENKKVKELSQGMKMKYSIALALSHKAKLLIMDEPTSGLDPVARNLLLDIFRGIIEEGECSILFSTHITSDLEKCADYITFIKNGEIIETGEKDELLDQYRLVSGNKEILDVIKNDLISYKLNSFGFRGLMRTDKSKGYKGIDILPPTLDDIMVYMSNNGGLL